MKTLFIAFLTTILFATKAQTGAKPNLANTPDCNIALKFINDYVKFSIDRKSKSVSNWIKRNPLLTKHFKVSYKKLVDSALKEDPEMGLESDPIFDAQDFPDEGFELVNCNNKTGDVTVRGKDWKEFVLVLKIVYQENKWLVEGSGVINMAVAKKAKR